MTCFYFFGSPPNYKLNEYNGDPSLKNAGNHRHFSSNIANFSGNGADPLDDGTYRLLQKSFLFGIFGSRKT